MSGKSDLIYALAGLVREVNGLVADRLDEKDRKIKELQDELAKKGKTMNVKVFGMENCAGCTTVKNVLKSKGVEFVELDVNNPDDMEAAMAYGVRSVPTTVIKRDDVEHIFTGGSIQTVDSIKLHLGIL